MATIKRVVDSAAFEAVSRFRYSIYVEEMNRTQKYANHDLKTILDPLDQGAVRLYAAWDKGEVVGTVRSNYLRVSDINDYYLHYNLEVLPQATLMAASITTRLMVHPRYRRSTLAVRLACETYRDGLNEGIAIDFIDCNDHLVPYFLGLGYVTHRNDLDHPEYGWVNVMRLHLTDLDHFQRIRSPFHRILRAWNESRPDTQRVGA